MARDLHRPFREAWIVDAVRTPIGRYGGALATVRPDDLAAVVIRSIVERTGIDAGLVEDVILGCANQAGEDNRNVARMASPAWLAQPRMTSSTSAASIPVRSTIERMTTAARSSGRTVARAPP